MIFIEINFAPYVKASWSVLVLISRRFFCYWPSYVIISVLRSGGQSIGRNVGKTLRLEGGGGSLKGDRLYCRRGWGRNQWRGEIWEEETEVEQEMTVGKVRREVENGQKRCGKVGDKNDISCKGRSDKERSRKEISGKERNRKEWSWKLWIVKLKSGKQRSGKEKSRKYRSGKEISRNKKREKEIGKRGVWKREFRREIGDW
jgi:hypothetical protein